MVASINDALALIKSSESESSSIPRSSSNHGHIHRVKFVDQLIIVEGCFSYWVEDELVQEVEGGTTCLDIGYEPGPVCLTPSLSLAL